MREIKFRALDKAGSTMWGWQRVKYWGNIFEDSSKIIMQYTELKDKNKKEIYEGDIVEYFGHIVVDGKQKYIKKQKIISIEDFHADCFYLKNIIEDGRCLEIIGKIYENPDKMKNYFRDQKTLE